MVVKGRPLDDDQGGGVEGIFNSARQHGAQVGGAEDLARARGELQPPQRFTGTARTLDGRVQPVAPSEDHGPRAHTITFYSNGVFTIDDGPARSVSDPQNTDLINSISRGECPQELAPENSTIPVEVNLVRKEEEYTPPAQPSFNAFQGTGHRMAAAASGAGGASSAAPAGEWQGVDESQPTTSIQLRLSDGSRLVAKFNLTHTVGDVRRFIRAARPDMTGAYELMTAFPSQPLADNSQTIEAAGLRNSVVIQKQ